MFYVLYHSLVGIRDSRGIHSRQKPKRNLQEAE